MYKIMPLVRTYMYDSGKNAIERAADVCVKQCLWLGLTCIIIEKISFETIVDV